MSKRTELASAVTAAEVYMSVGCITVMNYLRLRCLKKKKRFALAYGSPGASEKNPKVVQGII